MKHGATSGFSTKNSIDRFLSHITDSLMISIDLVFCCQSFSVFFPFLGEFLSFFLTRWLVPVRRLART